MAPVSTVEDPFGVSMATDSATLVVGAPFADARVRCRPLEAIRRAGIGRDGIGQARVFTGE